MSGSIPDAPGRVFMSYRRDDTDFPASWLYERLTGHLGHDQVFKDVDSIELGDDFVQVINTAVGSCDVLLALIGDRWLTIRDKDGKRRLDDPKDFVRLEIEAALKRRVRVIPILLGSAEMPTREELPASLSRLTRRQAMRLTPSRFEADIGRLLQVLDKTLLEEQAEREAKRKAEQEAEAARKAELEVEAEAARKAELEVEAEAARKARQEAEAEAARREAEQEAEAARRAAEPAPRQAEPAPVQAAPTPAVERAAVPAGPPGLPGARRRVLVVASLVTVAVLGAVGVFLLQPWGSNAPSPTSSPSSRAAAGTSTSTTGASAAAASADGPDILAHRGGWEEYPLETEAAFKDAAVGGYAIETDVRWTSDNKAVLVHDDTATAEGLECDRPYAVSKTPWATLNKYCRSYVNKRNNKQYPVATYAHSMEALAAIPGTWVYAEVKTDQTAAQNQEYVEVIRSNGMSDRTVVTSASLKRLAAIRAIAPELHRMLFVAGKQVPATSLAKEHLWAAAVELHIATKTYVQQLKDAGLKVVIWRVNEPSTWAKARALGADKVLTDNPHAYAVWAAK
jgi:glycerophosphoryl diester phosphodiesterase